MLGSWFAVVGDVDELGGGRSTPPSEFPSGGSKKGDSELNTQDIGHDRWAAFTAVLVGDRDHSLELTIGAGPYSGAQRLRSMLTVRWLATFLLRSAQMAGSRIPSAGYAIKQLNHLVTGTDIAWKAQIGPGLVLFHPTGVVIGPRSVIGSNCIIQQGVTIGTSGNAKDGLDSPIIGDRCLLGAGSRILGPVTVGDDVIVGANAVVIHDVPSSSIATGVPASSRPQRDDSQS